MCAIYIFHEVLQDFPYIFGCSHVGYTYVHNIYFFLMDSSLEYYEVSFYVSFYGLCFEVYFVWSKYPGSFSSSFAWIIFFQPFTFSLCSSFVVRWVSCRQNMCVSCFLIHSATLCLLIGKFNPFIFKVLIDRYLLIVIIPLCTSVVFFLFSSTSKSSPFSISCNAGLFEGYSFSLLFSRELLSSPSYLIKNLAG